METPTSAVAAFVLVGGESRRMGIDKALLVFHDKPMFLCVAGLLQPFVEEVTLLGPKARYAGFGLPVVEDVVPGQGPVWAVQTALKRSTHPWNLFFACDLPHLDQQIIELLLARLRQTGAQVIVPVAAGRDQPLCAAYHRSCLPAIGTLLESETNPSFLKLLSSLRVERILPGPGENRLAWERRFSNVNTRKEWGQLQSAASKSTA